MGLSKKCISEKLKDAFWRVKSGFLPKFLPKFLLGFCLLLPACINREASWQCYMDAAQTQVSVHELISKFGAPEQTFQVGSKTYYRWAKSFQTTAPPGIWPFNQEYDSHDQVAYFFGGAGHSVARGGFSQSSKTTTYECNLIVRTSNNHVVEYYKIYGNDC